jgi:integrase
MCLYKPHGSPYFHFDFWHRGHRFHGSTKATARREAEAIEREEREKAKRDVAQQEAAHISLRLDDVAGRYWREVGQYPARARNTEQRLEFILTFLGKDRLITDITGADVAALMAWRRGHCARGKLISPLTVNDTAKTLRALFTYCKERHVRFDHEPKWRKLFLPEPEERKRELVGDEAERIEAATPDKFRPFFAFAMATGLRFSECFLRWSEVDWNAGQIRKAGKGGKLVTAPITKEIRAILWPLQGHDPEFVFTYPAEWAGRGRVLGQRYPLTPALAKKTWLILRAEAGMTDFRFHDFRHDVGTKVLRETGNLKIAQRALNHASIQSTLRYAHVLDEEVRDAFERVAESRRKSRGLREVG